MVPLSFGDRALTPTRDSVCLGWKEKLEYAFPLQLYYTSER